MALGGGVFTAQNKVLPGSYVNFISKARASESLSDRGIAAIGLELDWGKENEIIELTAGDFQKNSQVILGYSYTSDKFKGLRELFYSVNTLYAYRLNGGGAKATNAFCTAKYSGKRGNDLKTVIQVNVDDETLFDVKTLLNATVIDTQIVAQAPELISNDFVDFKADLVLEATAGTALSGGTNGAVDGASHQAFLDKVEAYSFNAIGVVSDEVSINSLYTSFTRRMRDEVGAKFQCVVYNSPANYEGVVNVKNAVTDNDISVASLVYWVTGIIAGCEINKSNLNRIYDGEFTVNTDYTQSQLETAIKSGEFTLHKVGTGIRVLADINSLVTLSADKGEIFQDNQTIRVVDQIANDIAVLFNTKYLGNIPNDAAGRISLWTDIVKHHEQLQTIRAIESFSDADVIVEPGVSKKAVTVTDRVTIVNAMAQLYMTVTIE